MSSNAQPSGLFQRSAWLLLAGGLWLAAAAILISHFRFYYHVEWRDAIKWGLGDGFLWAVMIGLFLFGFQRYQRLTKSAHGVIAVFVLSIAAGVLLHPTISTLFFWAVDGSISRPFHLDVLHLVMKRLPQGILFGIALGFAGVLIANLEDRQMRRDACQTSKPTRSLAQDWVLLKDPRGVRRICIDDIDYLEAAGNYVAVHTTDGEQLSRTTLKALEQTLDGERFFRISRKHIVNLDKIQSVRLTKPKSGIVTLKNNIALPVGRRYRKALQDALEEASGIARDGSPEIGH